MRLGAGAGWVGAALLVVSTALHPSGSDPNDPPAAFAEYAADALWHWSHLGQFLGVALLAVALVVLSTTFADARSRALGRVGAATTAAVVAVAACLQAVDGVALKAMVDRWAAAGPETKAMAFEAAFAVRQVEIGLASLLTLSVALTWAVYGAAMLLAAGSARRPRLGASGLLGALAFAVTGLLQATTGFSPAAMTASMVASLALVVWLAAVGVLLWRAGPAAMEPPAES